MYGGGEMDRIGRTVSMLDSSLFQSGLSEVCVRACVCVCTVHPHVQCYLCQSDSLVLYTDTPLPLQPNECGSVSGETAFSLDTVGRGV